MMTAEHDALLTLSSRGMRILSVMHPIGYVRRSCSEGQAKRSELANCLTTPTYASTAGLEFPRG